MSKILVVDDDEHIREVVRFALTKAGYEVIEAGDGKAALLHFNNHKPDLIILDIMMPELDGTEVCRKIRQTEKTPIIFLTARDDEIDMIVGLELGGDDYINKPFSPKQLVARVRAVLRRSLANAIAVDDSNVDLELTVGKLYLNFETYQATWNHNKLTLTATEFRLLQVLAGRPQKVYNREDLMQQAYDNVVVSDRTIDSHIRRLRHKIAAWGGDAIETQHGLGYRLGSCK